MAARYVAKVYRSVFSINSGKNCRVLSPLLRSQVEKQSTTSHRASRIFFRGICLTQACMVKSSNAEWKSKLSPEQFWVCRQKGTEPPWSGEYVNFKSRGTYKCVCCDSELFSSSAKFDSGTGWPSFHTAIETTFSDGQSSSQLSVIEKPDNSYGMVRVEVLCRQCDSHLGHVFPDGPPPTGLRYCINSVSLKFQPEDEHS